MLMYFLIWFALGLYGWIYLTVLDYHKGIAVEISVGYVLLAIIISVTLGGCLAVWSLGHTLSGVFGIFTKPIFTLKRNKK